MSFNRELDRWHMRLATLEVAQLSHRGDAPSTWADETEFRYLAAFTPEQTESFIRELHASVVSAARSRSLAPLESTVRRWQERAATRLVAA